MTNFVKKITNLDKLVSGSQGDTHFPVNCDSGRPRLFTCPIVAESPPWQRFLDFLILISVGSCTQESQRRVYLAARSSTVMPSVSPRQGERPMPNGADPPVAGRTFRRLPDGESRRRLAQSPICGGFRAGKKNTARRPCFFCSGNNRLNFSASRHADETYQSGAE